MKHRRRRVRSGQEFSFHPKRMHFNRHKILRELLNWLVVVLIAAITGYAFVTFAFQTVTIVGPSMCNTLSDGEVVIVNKFVYKVHDIERYDIIAFSQVGSDAYYEVKRVIGLPDETVRIKDGQVYINGSALTDLPFDDKILTAGVANQEIQLGDDEYFVLGDNVNNSEDSRYTNVGNISGSEIIGEVVYRLYPKNNRGKIK